MKIFIGIILCLMVVCPIFSKDTPYKIMEFSLVGMNICDSYLTRYASRLSGFQEINPLAKITLGSDFRAVVFTIGISAIEIWGLEKLRKKNKTMGYIVLGVLIVAKGYVLYSNLRQLQLYNQRR